MKSGTPKAKLSIVAFGVAIAIMEALFLMMLAWAGLILGYGLPVIEHLATLFPGYNATFVGGLLGGLEGLIDGFIWGAITALIYNLVLCCCSCCCKKQDEDKKV